MSELTPAERLAILAAKISGIAGCPVEITVRGERSFTFSYEGSSPAPAAAILGYFGAKVDGRAKINARVEYDAECGTFVYVEVCANA